MIAEFAPGRVRKQNTYFGHHWLDLYRIEWWQLMSETLRHPAKTLCFTHMSAKIAPSKRARVSFISAEIALEKIFDDEDSADGMDSGEESDLDRQLGNESGGS